MTRASPSSATISISPSGQRQFRSTIRMPWASRKPAASSSPRRPRTSLALMPPAWNAGRPGRGRNFGYVGNSGHPGDSKPGISSPGLHLGQGELLVAREFLDVDVLEGDDADALDEPGGAVHVPDPGVLEGQVEVDLAVGAARLQVHVVGQVETPLGLDHIAEQPDDIAVFAVELQLHVGFIVFKV